MDEWEQKLGAILNDPNAMAQIQNLAQSLGGGQEQPCPLPQGNKPPPPMDPDPALLGRLTGLLRQSGVDREQQALLSALGPYLQANRIRKLERAMRAAKIARLATGPLGQGLLQSITGR